MNYQIITDSSCDLAREYTDKVGVKVVPFYVSFDENIYKKEGEEIEVREFYQQMVDNKSCYPKSSLPSVEDYVNAFEPFVSKDIPVICICITTKFSGSMNSALNAKILMEEKYEHAQITVIDSTINTVCQGALVQEVVRMKENGVSYEDAVAYIEKMKTTGRIFFTIGSIDYLKKGGRIGKLAGLLSNALKIQPIIQLKEGEIFPIGISRSRQKALKTVINQAVQYFKENNENPADYNMAVGYGYDYEESTPFKEQLTTALKEVGEVSDIQQLQIGATIGVHTGPYPLGLAFVKKYDKL